MSLFSNERVLSAGFAIDTPDKFGRTCLHAAAAGGWVASNFSCYFHDLITNSSSVSYLSCLWFKGDFRSKMGKNHFYCHQIPLLYSQIYLCFCPSKGKYQPISYRKLFFFCFVLFTFFSFHFLIVDFHPIEYTSTWYSLPREKIIWDLFLSFSFLLLLGWWWSRESQIELIHVHLQTFLSLFQNWFLSLYRG